MNSLDILGAVGASCLAERIARLSDGDSEDIGVARFMLDQLTGPQVAAIARAVLADGNTSEQVALFLPRRLVAGEGLPEHVITDKRTVEHRHAVTDKAVIILANTDDDQATSLQDITLLGTEELLNNPNLWVQASARGLPLSDGQREIWAAALAGMLGATKWSLHQVANYMAQTRAYIATESYPLRDALGWSLPSLHLPRDSQFFQSVSETAQMRAATWERLYRKLNDRALLLRKMRSARIPIERDELLEAFEKVKDEIPKGHDAIRAFIDAPAKWCPEAQALADYEWELDGITQLFSGLKKKRISLGEETIRFFELENPDALDDSERQYLDDLRKRKSLKDAHDEDVDFFEAHREEFNSDPRLRAKWERLVFGKPIECDDFLVGLLRAVERLWGQADVTIGVRRLVVRTTLGRARKPWLDLNSDIVRYFSVRYRGLSSLLGEQVDWDTGYLFRYKELTDWARGSDSKYKSNTSASRAATQLKFNVELHVGNGDRTERYATQIIWRGQPNAIGIELPNDLDRIAKQTLTCLGVTRQSVSRKGHLQGVSLRDVGTLEPAYGQDSGSLVSKLASLEDMRSALTNALEQAERDGRISTQQRDDLKNHLQEFEAQYSHAIVAFIENGLSALELVEQAHSFGRLLQSLANGCAGDLNRREIWQPILQVGIAEVSGGVPAAIVAPWHPLRLCAIAVKARWVCGLIRHLLTSESVDFGDRRLFFNDLCEALEHPYYPEIAVGYKGVQPVLLAASDTVNDYTLMEQPFQADENAATGVEPNEAARQIQQLLHQYLDLQPHEHADLSVVLYNCDSAGLPLKTVDMLGDVQNGQHVNCNVVLRHRDRHRLSAVYQKLIEQTGEDPDAVAPSEASGDFMSKLRIGIMLDESRPVQHVTGDRPFDIAFLHDVISRQAHEVWVKVDHIWGGIDALQHSPASWPYTRLSKEDELKATSYLACPQQPEFGWHYANAIASVVQRLSLPAGDRYLPARQITFQDEDLGAVLKEVHKLAEWVVNYDDLLDRRQLRAQDIQVIRYKRGRTHGRNLVVSSTADLRVLQVLVERRLKEVGLEFSSEEYRALAERMIRDASRVSGDIVLRAAKRGLSAGELVGLVLSKALAESELDRTAPTCWIFLDDYAEWLGQREEEIADLMALSIEQIDGKPIIRVIITEAKYVAAGNRAEAKRKSCRQTRDTVRRLENALFGDPGRLDRDLWLGRLSGLLVDHADDFRNVSLIEGIRERLRNGDILIDMRGYSHVFVHGPPEEDGESEHELIEKVPCGLQEVFNRKSLRALLIAYANSTSAMVVREELGDDRPWLSPRVRAPEARVSWTISGSETRPEQPTDVADAQPKDKGWRHPEPTVQISLPEASPEVMTQGRDGSDEPDYSLDTRPGTDTMYPPQLHALINERARPDRAGDAASLDWLEETTQALRKALIGYGLQGKVIGQRLTPNAALVRFRGSDRLRVQDVERKQSSLLTTHGLNVINVTAQPHEVVVTVARPEREVVSLWDVWAMREINRKDSGLNLSFVLGTREIDGELLYLNLTEPFGGLQRHDPHTLVAGATGSGKSVLMQCLLLDIAATNPSRLAHIYLIDPKMGVDYAPFERLPHLRGGIITEQERALEILSSLVTQMDERYTIFRKARVRDLHSYNKKSGVDDQLPAIWVFHDEFAEWMLTEYYRDGVTNYVQRLGVKARAAGIYLVFAAQRPEANVMPMQLRDNLGNRLILRVSSVGSSEIALGQKGAERLLGLGHLAARLTGEPDLIFAQGAFLPDDELEAAVDAICKEKLP